MSNIAIDLRSYLGMEKTHKNCTGTLCLPFTKEDDEKENYDSIGKCLFVIISILLRRWQ